MKKPHWHMHFTGHVIFKELTQQVICNKDRIWERKRQNSQSFVKKEEKMHNWQNMFLFKMC